MPRVPAYRVETYSYFKITDEGKQKFGQWLEHQDWTPVELAQSPSDQVEILHRLFDEGTRQAFEWKTRKKKMSEPSWVNDGIRDLISSRRKIYCRTGDRNETWFRLKRITDDMIEKSRKKSESAIRELFLNGGSPRDFFYCVKKLTADGAETPRWDVRSLVPDADDKQVAETMADFFNSISQEYEAISPDRIPTGHTRELPSLTKSDVISRIQSCKKPNSTVPGDIHPSLYALYTSKLAVPVTAIFNLITRTKEWPKQWAIEYVTVIPKCPSPAEIGDCRNLSCTNF